MRAILVGILFVFMFSLCVCYVESICCGKVYNGPNYLKDNPKTKAHHRIFASWSGFEGSCEVTGSSGHTNSPTHTGSHSPRHKPTQSLPGASGKARSATGAFNHRQQRFSKTVTYQVAVISGQLATNEIVDSGHGAPAFSPRCRLDSGINGLRPDVLNWRSVGFDQTFFDLNVTIESGVHYYILLAAQDISGDAPTIYSNSYVFIPRFHDGADDDDGLQDDGSDDDNDGDNDDDQNKNDDNNDQDDDSSNDDGLKPYQSGLIAMGCALFCLLLLLLLIIVVGVAKRGGEDKYTTTVHRNENVDKL